VCRREGIGCSTPHGTVTMRALVQLHLQTTFPEDALLNYILINAKGSVCVSQTEPLEC
jgi:hypothetical protein